MKEFFYPNRGKGKEFVDKEKISNQKIDEFNQINVEIQEVVTNFLGKIQSKIDELKMRDDDLNEADKTAIRKIQELLRPHPKLVEQLGLQNILSADTSEQ